MKKTIVPTLAAAFLATAITQSHAANFTWTGTTNGTWSTGTNWGGSAPSIAGADALIFSGSSNPNTTNDFVGAIFDGGATYGIDINSATGFTLAGNNLTLANDLRMTGGGNHTISLDMGLNETGFVVNGGANGTQTISGLISEVGTTNIFSLTGGIYLKLTNIGNTFDSDITINSGILEVAAIGNKSDTSGYLGAGNKIQLGNAGAANSGTLRYVGAGETSDKDWQVGGGPGTANTGGGIIENNGTSGALVLTANNTQETTTGSNRTLTLSGNNTANNTISGAIANNSANSTISLAKTGSGNWILSGNNTYTGDTTITGGTLKSGANNVIADTVQMIVRDGLWDLDGYNETIGSKITLGGAAGNATVSTGTGKVILSNNGLTQITYSASGSPNGAVVNGNLGWINTSNNNMNFTVADSANAAEDLTVNAVLSNDGTADAGLFYLTGSGVTLLNGNNTFDVNAISVREGTLVLGVNDTVDTDPLNPGTVSGALGENEEEFVLGLETNNSTVSLLLRSGVTSNRPITVNDDTTAGADVSRTLGGYDTTGTATFSGNITMNNDGAGIVNKETILTTPGGTVTFSGIIDDGANTVGIRKTGNGTVSLTGANTYGGDTVVDAGLLNMNTTTGSIASANVTINNTGTLRIGLSGNRLSPTANVTVNAGGTFDVRKNQAIGQLNGAGNVIGSIDAFNLTVGAGNFSGNFSGTNNLVKNTTGTLVLSGNNTYTGNTTVSVGNLTLSGGNAIADANTLIINGGKVDLASSETVGALVLGTTQLGNGTYGSNSSLAAVKDDAYFSGTGILTVGDGGGASAYDTWAGTFGGGFTGNNTAPGIDYDNDGLKNLLEFVLNGDPTSSQPGVAPALTVTGTDFVFSFNRRDDSVAETTVLFEYGNNLATWSNATVSAGNSTFTINATLNGTITVNSNNANTDAVSITIPKAASSTGKLFGRLNATQP
jgi:fibronectin-binding autotransporter adhesin